MQLVEKLTQQSIIENRIYLGIGLMNSKNSQKNHTKIGIIKYGNTLLLDLPMLLMVLLSLEDGLWDLAPEV